MSITWNEMLDKTFERQIEIEKESILDYNSNIEEFINLSIQEDELNVILIYGVTNSKYFSHIYRMAIYPRTETKSIYREGNVIDHQGYNIEDVKKRAKTYLNHYLNKL